MKPILQIAPLLCASLLASGTARAGDAPEFVLRIARAAQALPEAAPARARGDAVQEFADWFLEGYAHPDGPNRPRDKYMQTAWTAGDEFRRKAPDRSDEIMRGYGYTRITVEGVWSREGAGARFLPQAHEKENESETWWLASFGDGHWSESQPRVRIEGYLSAPGNYGDGGKYARELLATGVTPGAPAP